MYFILQEILMRRVARSAPLLALAALAAGIAGAPAPLAAAARAVDPTYAALRNDPLAGQQNPAAPPESGQEPGLFLACVAGKRYPPALAAVDPRGVRALGIDAGLGGAETVSEIADERRGGIWYLSHLKREVEAHETHPARRLADDLDYRVDSRVTMSVGDNPELAGTTTLKLVSAVAGLRLLPIDLLPRLRLESAEVSPADREDWKPAAFVQE